MKQILVNFNLIDIGASPISYSLSSNGSSFKVSRTGFAWTKAPMNLYEAIEFIVSDIRNLRAVSYSEANPNIDLQTLFNDEDKIKLPEFYKIHVDKLVEKITQGISDFVVTTREGKAFVDNNTIHFDNAFISDIEKLSKLKQ